MPEQVADYERCLLVARFEEMGVNVECRRCVCVTEPSRYGAHRNPRREQLRRVHMA